MKLKIVFSVDPTGMSQDVTEVINFPKNTCLFCLHDKRHNIGRLYNEVKKSLEYKGYNSDDLDFLQIMKIYTM